MLAMDVVDTLRHREAQLESELATGAREEELLERLRQIYASQGIEVPDKILKEGINALREGRFVYSPPERSSATFWATAYVNRGRWGKLLLTVVLLSLMAWGVHWVTVVSPKNELAKQLNRTHATVLAVSEDATADALAESLYGGAARALARNDRAEAREALTALEELRERVELSFELKISPGPDTGFWRVPDVNTMARNYYVVVDALDDRGRSVTVPVRSEETGKTARVTQWGVRVDEETFEAVRADKLDDGIIQNSLFGVKKPGTLEPDYLFPTSGGAVTDWSEW